MSKAFSIAVQGSLPPGLDSRIAALALQKDLTAAITRLTLRQSMIDLQVADAKTEAQHRPPFEGLRGFRLGTFALSPESRAR